ncbi:MAG: hypothetical protein O7D95_06550 [Betaproteobacteria bacterium]|nr:hypothetical protein [Betaproteobacteria bacterium]
MNLESVPDDQKEQITREIIEEQQAQEIINKVGKYFVEYEQQLFKEIKTTKWEESDKRNELYRQLKSLDTVAAKITRAIQTGKMARTQLTQWQKAAKQVKNMVGL